MRTIFQHIHFVVIEEKPKTSVWGCLNTKSDDMLGIVKWYGPWRQYCFFPMADCVFSKGCLEDINQFIGSLSELSLGDLHALLEQKEYL